MGPDGNIYFLGSFYAFQDNYPEIAQITSAGDGRIIASYSDNYESDFVDLKFELDHSYVALIGVSEYPPKLFTQNGGEVTLDSPPIAIYGDAIGLGGDGRIFVLGRVQDHQALLCYHPIADDTGSVSGRLILSQTSCGAAT